MAGDASTAADGQVDIIGHILDADFLEVPFINAPNIFDGRVDLPVFDPIFGIDLSITRHVVMMWAASTILIVALQTAFRRPQLVPSGLANLFEAMVLFVRDEVVMPAMGGFELAEIICERRRDLKVLFMSGYARPSDANRGKFTHRARLLQKPVKANVLAQNIRRELDNREPRLDG